MMYSSPMVENNFTDPSDSKSFSPIKFKPFGPISTPERMRPMIAGMRNFLNTIGERRIINKINENISTGLRNGKWNASMR